jgi:hypothetical protein
MIDIHALNSGIQIQPTLLSQVLIELEAGKFKVMILLRM